MPQIINTNIASLNAQRNLNSSQEANKTALQRLSSGLRVNSAKDDAAGLAISTRFDSQVRGLNVAMRNAGDGVSLSQVAEGSLGAMTDALQRIRDLALQSANATNNSLDRQALNAEVIQLKAEIGRIAEQTAFNGTKLLDGSFQAVTFQIGANKGEDITFDIAEISPDTLGTAMTNGISSSGKLANPLAAGDLVINGVAIRATTSTDDAFSSANSDASALAVVTAINEVSDKTGVTAVANPNSLAGTALNANSSGTISINGVTINAAVDTTNLDASGNLQAVVEAINAKSGQTGVTAAFNPNYPSTGITLSAEDGRNIVLANGTANTNTMGLATAGTYVGNYTMISEGGKDIELSTTTGNIDNAGLEIGTFSGANSGIVGDNVLKKLTTGDLVINGISVGETTTSMDTASSANADASGISMAAAINAVSEQTGVTATANTTVVNGGTITSGTSQSGNVSINGVAINIAYTAADTAGDIQQKVVDAVNAKSGQTGVMAEAFGSTFRLLAEDGRNIQVGTVNTITNAGFTASTVTTGSVTLKAAGPIELSTITGNIANAGLEVGSFGGGQEGQLLRDVDISTVKGALDAVQAVDNALQTINIQRANLGAIQNRFESTITNQSITTENLQAANSRIRDADFAAETAALSRSQVLQSAGLSILSQANGQPQQVLQLLQG